MIRTFVFNQGRLINENLSLELLRVVLYDDDVQVWVDMENATPDENKAVLETVFDFHPLAIEDCIAITERPKVDDYSNYVFLIIHAVDYINSLHVFQTTELSMFIGKNFLVTYHDDPLKSISNTIDRIQKKNTTVARTPDRLAYHILDILFDNYQPALDELSAEIAALEHQVLTGEQEDILSEVAKLQTEVQRLRQIMAPQRDVISRMMRGEFPKLIRPPLIPYLRDLLDNLARISDLAETYRESLSSTLQIHLNLQQMQVNKVIKVLTVMATLSLPIVGIASFYGMNFEMVEFKLPGIWPYIYILALISITTGTLYWIMKRSRWL